MKNVSALIKVLLLIFATFSCFCILNIFIFTPTLVDMRYHDFYRNEMVIITANIESYKASNNGHPPPNLEEVEKITLDFLKENPDIKERYLVTSWTSRKIILFKEARYGYEIGYFTKNNDYYLYLPTHKCNMSSFDRDKSFLLVVSSCPNVIIVKNGIVISGPMPINSEPFNVKNLKKELKDCSKYAKPGFITKILIETYEKISDLV